MTCWIGFSLTSDGRFSIVLIVLVDWVFPVLAKVFVVIIKRVVSAVALVVKDGASGPHCSAF
jgi:hypothetical protein